MNTAKQLAFECGIENPTEADIRYYEILRIAEADRSRRGLPIRAAGAM